MKIDCFYIRTNHLCYEEKIFILSIFSSTHKYRIERISAMRID